MNVDKQNALLQVSHAIAAHKNIDQMFEALTNVLRSAIQFDFVYIQLYDPSTEKTSYITPKGAPLPFLHHGKPISFKDSPGWEVWSTQKSCKLSKGNKQYAYPEADENICPRMESRCIVPLTSAYRRIGTLELCSQLPGVYTDQDVIFIEQAASQVAISIDNALNYEAARKSNERLKQERNHFRVLLDMTNVTVSKRDIKDLMSYISGELKHFIGAEYVTLHLYDKQRQLLLLETLYFPSVKSDVRAGATASVNTFPWDSVCSAFIHKKPFVANHALIDKLAKDYFIFEWMSMEALRGVCVVPLYVSSRGVFGLLTAGYLTKETFSDHDLELLNEIARQLSMSVDNALAYREISQLKNKLASEKLYLEEEIRADHNFGEIIGESTALKEVLKQVEIVAQTDSTVLIFGETGTGKELVARAIHDLSDRKRRALVKLNCSSIPSGLLESELFGHEKGAYTGAVAPRTGRLELAHQGTLFLDEIGELPLELQPKLLRALQEQEFEPLGGNRVVHVDIRLIAATNRNLEAMIADRQFRSDLYYRLSVFPIVIPPLRERRDDIPLLVRHFTQKFARKMNRRIDSIPRETMHALLMGNWPGNVRELKNVIERAVILSTGPELRVPPGSIQKAAEMPPALQTSESPVRERESGIDERGKILRALREAGNIISGPNGVAAKLDLTPTALLAKMHHFNIPVNEEQKNSDGRKPQAYTDDLKAMEREVIKRVLRESNGVIGGEKGAAVRLGIKRTTLLARMARLGISLD